MRKFLYFFLFSFCSLSRLQAGEEVVWNTSFEAAQALARDQQKDIFVLFTGTNWCGPCKKLDREVFSKRDFASVANQDFIFLKYEYRARSFRASEIKSDKKIRESAQMGARYVIRAYPTMYVLTSEGRAYSRVFYRGGGFQSFLASIADLAMERESIQSSIEEASTNIEPSEQATRLAEVLATLESQTLLVGYENEMKKIIKLDPDNSLGLFNRYSFQLAMKRSQELVAVLDGAGAIAEAEQMLSLEGLDIEQRQDAMIQKAKGLTILDRKTEALDLLDEAAQLDPNTFSAMIFVKMLRDDIEDGNIVFSR